MKEERIQKILSQFGVCSRRSAEELIKKGKVKVNGRVAGLGDKVDPQTQVITVDGQRIYTRDAGEKLYYMLNKPRGYVTTMSDELGRKSVMSLVEGLPSRVYPVGRLDKDSEGLLLFTNDGDFANRLMHPSGDVSKVYRVTVRPGITEDQLVRLSTGITVDSVRYEAHKIEVIETAKDRSVLVMILKQGKNRHIRKMCESVGLEVIRLKRTIYGTVKLGMLKPGTYRSLTKQEISSLRSLIYKNQ